MKRTGTGMVKHHEQIKQVIEAEIQAGFLAGANVLAIKDGRTVYEHSFGMANIEKNQELTLDSIFRLYSLSKPITAVAILILVDQGKLKLTDDLSLYLPSFLQPKVESDGDLIPSNREVTIFDLLTMTAGVVYPDGETISGKLMGEIYDQYNRDFSSGKVTTTLDFINQMGTCPLAFQPGEEWRYGSCADVLGAVVEVVSGMRYSEFLRRYLFEPLGMRDTGFYVPKDKQERMATVYEYDDHSKLLKPYDGLNLSIFPMDQKPGFESGGAGIVSTILDYAKFAQMLLNEGSYEGKTIIQPETFHTMKQNYLTKEQKKTYNWNSLLGFGYGFLVRVLEDSQTAGLNSKAGTFGWDGWTGPYLAIDPENKAVFLYFISKINTGTTPTTKKIHNLLADSL